MSNADRNKTLGQVMSETRLRHDGAGGSTGECAAESLKSLIAHVASQISDADQRHTEMLRQMQARLQSLGIEARSIRDRVPGQYVPAFDRIEEGMQLLADRIAHTHDGRPDSHTEHPAPQVATRPANGPDLAAHVAPAASAAAPASIDLGQAAAATVQSEPWDREQADALADLYHSGQTGMPAGLADPEADTFDGAGNLAFVHANAAHSADIEREWLEERFADIAHRVEQSLAEMRPESSFLALGRRFEQFEERMASVLEDVATRSDVEGLRLIEAHISELAQHLDQTQMQLERLDGIEAQLNVVVSRLTDDRFVEPSEPGHFPAAQLDEIVSRTADRVASQLVGMGQIAGIGPHGDYEQLATRAAEQAITRFAYDVRQSRPEFGDQPGELRSIVEDFIRERRQGEEQTAAVLDTVQQAMIRVLDRIDAIELQSQKTPIPAAPQEYVREQARFAIDPRDATDLGKSTADFAGQHYGAATDSHLPQPASPFAHAPGSERRQSAAPPASAAMAGDAAQPSPNPNGPGRAAKASIEKLRHDFIADAQRAKLRAQAEAPPAAADAVASGAAVTLSRPVSASTPASTPAAAKSAPAGAPAGARSAGIGGMPIKKIMVAALGLVIVFQGANLLLARRNADSSKPVATPAKATAPTASDASGAAAKAAKPKVDSVPASAVPTQAPVKPSVVNPSAAQSRMDLDAPAAMDLDSSDAPLANAAPKPGAPATTSKFAVPTKPHKPNTVPETMLEELDFKGEAVPGDGQQRAGETVIPRVSHATGSIPVGISLQTSARPLTPHDLARLQQQQQMANMSSKLGAAAAQAMPASLLPDLPPAPSGNVAAALADKAAQQKSALELPPVTVGPLSLRLAAAKGDPSAEFEVGARLAEGKGTDQSFKDAVKWYTRSANQGFAQAQYRLGTLYERGLGVKSDPARARVWYSRAAEQGNVKAMHNLAVLSAGSKSGSPDYSAAAHWFGEAAVRGLGDSQFNLAVLYDSGLGVSKDTSLAYQWFALAARSGDKEAVRRRDLAKAALPATDAAAIDARVASWLPQSADQMANDARAAGEAWKRRENAEEGNG